MQAVSFAYIFKAMFQRPSLATLQVTLAGALGSKVNSHAPYESGLVTDITKGENKGQVLSSEFVVWRLEKLCTVKDMSTKKMVSGTVSFPLWVGFNGIKCGMVVFV